MTTNECIKKCSIYANESYRSNIKSLDGSILLENIQTDTQIHIGKDKDTIYIIGRGTENMTDIKHDIKIWRRKCSFLNDTLVHSGFLEQYESIRKMLLDEFKKLTSDNSCKKIICTGHSLGAALATIAALDMKLLYPPFEVSCITFASPRVGSPGFAKLFNKKIDNSLRYVYHRDPVTFIPICLRFRHVKGLVHFKKNGKTVISEDYFFPLGCLISQHYMEKYKESIAKNYDNPLFCQSIHQ